MIARAITAGVPFACFTAHETYGQAKWLHAWLEGQDIWYVMAIRCSDTLTTPEGERRVDDLIAAVPPRSWQTISAGAGAHGPREYDWARVRVVTRSSSPRAMSCSTSASPRAHLGIASMRVYTQPGTSGPDVLQARRTATTAAGLVSNEAYSAFGEPAASAPGRASTRSENA